MIEYIKIAVFFAAGVYLYERIDVGFALIFMLSLIMVLTITAIFKHKFNIKILIMISALVLGVLLGRYAMCGDKCDLHEYSGRYVTLTGRVCEIPRNEEENVQYTVNIKKAVWLEKERKVNDKVLLTAPAGFEYGDTIEFSGFIEELPKVMNTDGVDFAKYYKKQGIFYKMYSDNPVLSEEKYNDYSLYSLNVSLKSGISALIDNHYNGDYNAILKAVLTGNKKEFSEDFDKVLTRTGSKRFFYPAFLHVMLFMAAISLILGAVGKKKRDMATVFLLIIYAMLNCSNAVFVKLSLLMAFLIFMEMRFGRVYYLDILGITAIVMGMINPLFFFDSAFAMSMLSSVMIYYFADYINEKLSFIKMKYVRRTLTVGIICTIGLIPIAAYFFNYVSLHSILLSIIMLPCVAVIVLVSPLFLVMLALFGLAPVVGQIVSFMVFVLKNAPILIDKIFGEGLTLAKPGILLLIIYVLLIVAAVKGLKHKTRHAKTALFVAAALTVSVTVKEITRLNDTEITFVNVGQGDGALISAPHRFNVLIDGGGGNAYSDYNPGERVYLEYLKTKGITRVDSAFVSHYHKDHVQGIIAAVENIRVRNLFLPDELPDSEWRLALEKAAEENGTKVHYISEETLLTYNNGMRIRIIPPAPKTAISDDENDTTYVYHMEYGEFSALFTGDMSSFAEKNLIEKGKAYQADVLKVAHHGSKTSTSSEWVEAVSPQYAVISVGEDNTYALPNEKTLETLKGTKLFRTDYDGDIKFTAEKDGSVKIETLGDSYGG